MMRRTWIALAVLVGLASLPVAMFGVDQLATTATRQLRQEASDTDFLNLYSGAFLFLRHPESTYSAAAQATLQSALQSGGQAYRPFLIAPHGAMLLAPLALLPFGAAYLVWLLIGVGGLGLSAYLLAPRNCSAWSWLPWLPLVLLYLPAQQALIMGQTSVVALLGWCVFVRGLTGTHSLALGTRGLALVPWSLKPQLLPVYLLALALDRKTKDLVVLLMAIGVLTTAALVRLGPDGSWMYVSMAIAKVQSTDTGGSTVFNVTLVAGAEWLLGGGLPAKIAAAMCITTLWLVVIRVWRRGLVSDHRWMLQVALLPVVAVLSAPYALTYELTTWLASAWLVVRYCRAVEQTWLVVPAFLLAVWLAADLAIIFPQEGARLATLSGVALIGLLAWLFRVAPMSGSRSGLASRHAGPYRSR